MKAKILTLLPAACLFLAYAHAHAADLTTRDGTVYRNVKVISHDAGSITIMDSDGGQKIPLSNLPADLQKQYGYDPAKSDAIVQAQDDADSKERQAVAQSQIAAQQQQAALAASQRAAHPFAPAAGTAPAPLSAFASQFAKSLAVLQNGALQDVDPRTLAPVRYWAFYYSASWCPPCRAFTPDLVAFYKQFKPTHPNFELVFVNDDHSEADMLSYITGDGMTWPSVRYASREDGSLGIQKYCGDGIPCLVLTDATGTVLSDTNRNGQYVGPQEVMDDIPKMVK